MPYWLARPWHEILVWSAEAELIAAEDHG
ncbi:hypothetical protein FP2506_11332 [Fulvimarina pelagi HTCC2506]|uniref:Uncharacterized protein n=1 Tax=Fulvimarina pelagi HTCC2506 TaxID=314231 RepID=Q0FZ13_9HYPH|nr:hypothetical protein FP2506_11332 [Fulvimarina pelagi HTCC2506]